MRIRRVPSTEYSVQSTQSRPPCSLHYMPTLNPSTLESFGTQLLRAGGISSDEAALVAASLVDANLKGYDSHGVMRVPYYVQAIRDGEVAPGADLTILDEGPS